MKLKGSYTVEATAILAFCLIVFGGAVGLAYDVFEESVAYVSENRDEIDAVKLFRGKEELSNFYEEIKG